MIEFHHRNESAYLPDGTVRLNLVKSPNDKPYIFLLSVCGQTRDTIPYELKVGRYGEWTQSLICQEHTDFVVKYNDPEHWSMEYKELQGNFIYDYNVFLNFDVDMVNLSVKQVPNPSQEK